MKTLLFNASGHQGNAISQRLQNHGHTVLAPVRSEAKRDQLAERGLHPFITDFSTETLLPHMGEVDRVVLQVPAQISPALMRQFAERIVHAVVEAGRPKTVFVISSTVPQVLTGKASPDARWYLRNLAEKHLPEAIILSATEYLENFSTSYRSAIEEQGMIPQTIPAHLPVNYLSWNDLASYVHACLESNTLAPGFYAIGGREGITGEDLAARLGAILEKPLRYHTLTHQQLEGFLSPIVGPSLAAELAEFYAWQDLEGFELLNPDTASLRNQLSLELPTFEDWAWKAFLAVNQ